MSHMKTDVSTVASIFYGALLYLAALGENSVSAGHFGFGTVFVIGPVMLFHFTSGVLAIGGPSPTPSALPGVYLFAAAATLLSSAGAVALTMILPMRMPLTAALCVVFATWIVSGVLALYLRARTGNGYQGQASSKPDPIFSHPNEGFSVRDVTGRRT